VTGEAEADRLVHLIAADWRGANLSAVDHALCAYAEKLTERPGEMEEGDLQRLRECGLNDRAIHDATQVIGYFNYINRMADALGVDYEEFIREWEQSAEPIRTNTS
jgi:uncharacterized peroxidase-related enzyme